MTWCSFGEREGKTLAMVPSTGADVGPGSYNVAKKLLQTVAGQAPFNSTAARQGIPGSGYTATPEPGMYELPNTWNQNNNRIQGRKPPFGSGARRSGEAVRPEQMPGPGSYAVTGSIVKNGKKMEAGTMGVAPDAKSKGPPRNKTAPSIPRGQQCYGYEEYGAGNQLVQQGAPEGYSGEREDKIASNNYNPDDRLCYRERNAPRFSNASRWKMVKPQIEEKKPGPGEYNPVLPRKREVARQSPAFIQPHGLGRSASSPAVAQKKKNKEEDQGPGPAAYTLPSAIKSHEKPPEELQFFGSNEPRFHSLAPKHATPAPGNYDPQAAFNALHKTQNARFARPNGLEMEQPRARPEPQDAPPEELYSIEEEEQLTNARLMKSKSFSVLANAGKSGFLSTSRQRPKAKKHTTPGPMAYQSVKVVDTSPKKPSANFLSGTQRDPSEVKAMLGTEEMRPDPGSYIIPDPRRSIMGGVHRRNAQYAFGSNQSRFGIKGAHRVDNNYRFYDVTQNLGNSGFRKKLRSRGNMTNCGFDGSEDRFKEMKADEKPGPGAYYSMKSNLLTSSFNARLGGPRGNRH